MSNPNEQDIAYLRANPDVAGKFDERFGEGASAQYIPAMPAPEAVTEPAVTPQTDTPGGSFSRRQGRLDGLPAEDVMTEKDELDMATFSDALSRRPGIRSTDPDRDHNVMGQIGDMVAEISSAAGNGIEEAINETADFLADAGSQTIDPDSALAAEVRRREEAGEADTSLIDVGALIQEAPDVTDIDVFNEPVTALGRFTSSTTQFFAGFLGAGKITGLKGLVGGMVNGAAADGVVMNPDDPNLSAFLEANEYGPEWLTTALSTDPDDPEWLNRMRNVTEGAVLGGAAELVFLGFRSIAKGAQAGKMEPGPARNAVAREAEELADEVAELSEAALRDGVPPAGTAPQYKSVAQLMEDAKARREGLEPVQTPSTVREDATPVDRAEGRPEGDVEPRPESPREEPSSPSAMVDDDALRAAVRSSEDVTVETLSNSRWLNARRMTGPLDAQRMIDIAGSALDRSGAMERLGAAGPQSLESIRKGAAEELGAMVGAGGDEMTRRLARIADSSTEQTRFLVAGKMALQSLGREAATMARQLNDAHSRGLDATELEAQFLSTMRTHANTQAYVKAIQTNAARTTSAGRIETGDALNSAEVAALRQVEEAGGSEAVKAMARQVRLSEQGPIQLARTIRQQSQRSVLVRGMNVVNEVFINNILSGYPTHLVNIASNSINVAYLPFERALGGAITRNPDQIRAALTQYAHLRSAAVDGVRMMGRVLKTEAPVLDTQIKLDIAQQGQKAITRENFGVKNALGGSLIDGLGQFLRIPGRALMAEDEFFKQMTFRSRLNADLSVAARNLSEGDIQGMGYASRGEFVQGETEAAILSAQRANDLFDQLVMKGRVADTPDAREAFVRENQGAANEGSQYAQDALRAAREATFTSPLAPGTLSNAYQGMANRHPFLRQITPFIQTPVNIINKAFDRVPGVNLLRSRYRDRLRSENPAIRAEAAGEMATGVAISTALYMLALEGRITGGGPVDGGKREMWSRDKAWQPYSLNIGTTEDPEWIEFRRMDPYAFSLGIAGDISEMIQASEDDPSLDTAGLFAMLVASVGNNLTSKTWLQGISDAVEVLSSKDRPYIAQRWLENKVASFVPFASAGRTLNSDMGDGNMREARGYIDRIKSSIPGMSDELATRYDWINGQSIENPTRLLGFLRASTGEGNVLDAEIRRLNYDFTGPDRKIGAVTLSPEQFQRWNELMGTVAAPSAGTLSQALTRTMQRADYDLARERVPDGITSPAESHRVKMLARIMTRYKQASRRTLFEEYPELYDAWREAETFRRRAQQGQVEAGQRENLITGF